MYDDRLGNQAALNCEVYYLVDKEVKNVGRIESMGTAYPISYDETGIYAASGHAMQRFEIEAVDEVLRHYSKRIRIAAI